MNSDDCRKLHLMLVVGEPSGDALGGQLMARLKELAGDKIVFSGVGGPAMEAEGLSTLFSLDDTSVMGLREVVPKIPAILRRVNEATDHAIQTKPDLVVLIDSPDFTHRIARRLKRLAPEIPVAKYVAPQVWASRPWRAKKLNEFVDHLLALLPFEPAFFEEYGVKTHFVGHPVVERAAKFTEAELNEFRTRLGLSNDTTVLTVLPGSRSNEVRFLGPIFGETVQKVAADIQDLRILVPTVPHVREKVMDLIGGWPGEPVLLDQSDDKFKAFKVSTAGLAASGTVTTEAALAGLPIVVGYKVGWLTEFFARILMVSKYMTLLNLIADEEIIPEFLPKVCTADNLTAALGPLLKDSAAREAQVTKTAKALSDLGVGGAQPSRRAAEAILEIMSEKKPVLPGAALAS